MKTLKQRVLVTLIAILLAAACGAGCGYLAGRAQSRRLAYNRLTQAVYQAGGPFLDLLNESNALLNRLNASKTPYCSAEETAYFRQLLFQSDYLRDAGRMHNGRVLCSTMFGRRQLSSVSFQPFFTRQDGLKIYRNVPPFLSPNWVVFLLQKGDSYVVEDLSMKNRWPPPNLEYESTLLDTVSGRRVRPGGKSLLLPDADLGSNKRGSEGDTLYVTVCAAGNYMCTTAFESWSKALRADHDQVLLYVALGGLSGAILALILLFTLLRSRSMDHQLRRAISKERPRVVYQPIVDMTSRRIVGAEALARWTDEDGFEIGPDVFVKIAEQCGFMGDLTRLIVRRALREMGPLLRSHPEFKLSLNVSASDLSDPEFLPMLEQALARESVAPPNVAIEITESSTANNGVAIATIRQLRARGHSVHVDDFGTGYSSLSYLHDLAVDAIKIDRSFTRAIGTEAVTVGILPQILAMAQALKLHIIVEGVETGEQASYFAGLADPVQLQGWLFGRPVPVEDFQRILAADDHKNDPLGSAA